MATHKLLTPGTIIHGTLRDADVIPALLRALDACDRERADAIREVHVFAVRAVEQDARDWMQARPDDVVSLSDALYDALQDHAPEGHYVGMHPGDGSDLGVWPVED